MKFLLLAFTGLALVTNCKSLHALKGSTSESENKQNLQKTQQSLPIQTNTKNQKQKSGVQLLPEMNDQSIKKQQLGKPKVYRDKLGRKVTVKVYQPSQQTILLKNEKPEDQKTYQYKNVKFPVKRSEQPQRIENLQIIQSQKKPSPVRRIKKKFLQQIDDADHFGQDLLNDKSSSILRNANSIKMNYETINNQNKIQPKRTKIITRYKPKYKRIPKKVRLVNYQNESLQNLHNRQHPQLQQNKQNPQDLELLPKVKKSRRSRDIQIQKLYNKLNRYKQKQLKQKYQVDPVELRQQYPKKYQLPSEIISKPRRKQIYLAQQQYPNLSQITTKSIAGPRTKKVYLNQQYTNTSPRISENLPIFQQKPAIYENQYTSLQQIPSQVIYKPQKKLQKHHSPYVFRKKKLAPKISRTISKLPQLHDYSYIPRTGLRLPPGLYESPKYQKFNYPHQINSPYFVNYPLRTQYRNKALLNPYLRYPYQYESRSLSESPYNYVNDLPSFHALDDYGNEYTLPQQRYLKKNPKKKRSTRSKRSKQGRRGKKTLKKKQKKIVQQNNQKIEKQQPQKTNTQIKTENLKP